jgi:hypothetical protein
MVAAPVRTMPYMHRAYISLKHFSLIHFTTAYAQRSSNGCNILAAAKDTNSDGKYPEIFPTMFAHRFLLAHFLP